MERVNHIHVLNLPGVACLVLRDKYFMKLLARTDSDLLHFTAVRYGMHKVDDVHAGNLRHEHFTAVHRLDAAHHESNALFQGDPESGHSLVSYGHASVLPLLQE